MVLDEQYRIATPDPGIVVLNAAKQLTIQSYFKIQPNRVLVRPSATQTVKYAWVQYLSILILFYFGGTILSHFLYTQQIIEAEVTTESHLLAPNNVSHPRDKYKFKKL